MSEQVEHRIRTSRRTAYTAFGWVLVFLAWHIVWAATGLAFPQPSDRTGAARILLWVLEVVLIVMVAIGVALPLALARPWGRRIPRWMLLWTAWIGCALLGVRGIWGVADDLARVVGLSRGLSGMTTAQVMGTAHPSAWLVCSSTATDGLFVAGGLLFGFAAWAHQRAFPGRVAVARQGTRPSRNGSSWRDE